MREHVDTRGEGEFEGDGERVLPDTASFEGGGTMPLEPFEGVEVKPWMTQPPLIAYPPLPEDSLGTKLKGLAARYGIVALVAVLTLTAGAFLVFNPSEPEEMVSDEELALLANRRGGVTGVPSDARSGLPSGISVQTIPSDATVSLDFDSVGTTPMANHALGSGTYLLSISKPGYVTYDTLLSIRAGDRPSLRFVLQPWGTDAVPSTVSQILSENSERPSVADPSGSRPRVEGADRQAPIADSGAREGEDGLVPEVAEAFGTLAVLVRPWGSIYIDDELHRSDTDIQYNVQLPTGPHQIRAVHPTLGAVQRTVRIEAGASERVVLNLNPSGGRAAPADAPPSPQPAPAPTTEPSDPPAEAKVYAVAEEPPVLIGGLAGLHRAARYPEQAYNFGLEGRVFLQFIVDENGRVQDPVVTRGLGMGCDEEALRVIRQARFEPGKVGGKPVKARHALFINFEMKK